MDLHEPLDPTQFAHLRVSTMIRTHTPRYCTLPFCDGEMYARDMCQVHYRRWLRGMPLDISVVRRRGRCS